MSGCAGRFEAQREQSRPLVKIGMDKLSKGDEQTAFIQFSKAEDVNPSDPEVFYGLALTYRRWLKYDLALKYVDKSISNGDKLGFEHPGMKSEAYNLKGDILFQLKRYDDALECFAKALEDDLYPDPQFSWYNKGLVYFSLNKDAQARKCFNAALAKDEHYAPAWLGLGQLANREGKNEEALRFLQKAVKEFPDYAEAHVILSQIYLRQGDKKSSAEHLRQVIRIDQTGPLGRQAQGVLYNME